MTTKHNLHKDVLQKVKDYILDLRIEEQLINLIKFYDRQKNLGIIAYYDEQYGNHLERYFSELMSNLGVTERVTYKRELVVEKSEKYTKLKYDFENSLKSTKELLDYHKGISNQFKSSHAFQDGLENVLQRQIHLTEKELDKYEVLYELTHKMIENRSVDLFSALEDKLNDFYLLVSKKYANEYSKALSLFFGKKVFITYDSTRHRFYFEQYMQLSEGELIDKFLGFLEELFEFSIFIKEDDGGTTEFLYARKKEYYSSGVYHFPKNDVSLSLKAFLKKHPEFHHYILLLQKIVDLKGEKDWSDATIFNMQHVIFRQFDKKLIDTFNELVAKEQLGHQEKESQPKDKEVKLEDYLVKQGLRVVTEERVDLAAQYSMYRKTITLSNKNKPVKSEMKSVIIGFESDKYLFV